MKPPRPISLTPKTCFIRGIHANDARKVRIEHDGAEWVAKLENSDAIRGTGPTAASARDAIQREMDVIRARLVHFAQPDDLSAYDGEGRE